MLARTGNMADVYREFHRMNEIADAVEPQMTAIADRSAALDAEISEGSTAAWYLVETHGGDDLKAMHWLARRRFGVFRPMQQRKAQQHEGQRIGGMEPVFPGWLFVYVWGIDKMKDRIKVAPGVRGILSDPVTYEPIEIDDAFIEKVQNLSWIYDERIGHVARQAHRQRRTPKLGKSERKAIKLLKVSLKRLGKFDPSTWVSAAELAPAKRIALLQQALNGPVAEGVHPDAG